MDLISAYRALERPRVAGIMSGTSADAIDISLVEIRPQERPQLLYFFSDPLPLKVRERLQVVFRGQVSLEEVTSLHWLLGELLAQSLLKMRAELKSKGLEERIDLVASHGQTVWHAPKSRSYLGYPVRGTLQLGEGAVIATRASCLTVCDFRPQDLALGGQGAPLVPWADRLLFYEPTSHRVALNIGGMANITILPASGEVSACDTGPGNALSDRLAEIYWDLPYDPQGQKAAQGQIIPELWEELCAHPYLAAPAPKSTGREEFGAPLAERWVERAPEAGWSPYDLLRTAAAFSAYAIALHIKRLAPATHEILVGGGGLRNQTMMRELAERLAPLEVEIRSMESVGVPPQARESMAFALLGDATLRAESSNLPSATGASRPCVLGKIVLP